MALSLLTSTLFPLLLCIQLLKPSFGIDTLVPGQSIHINQTLISNNQVFEMGFFSLGKSSNTYLGIWYKITPDVVIWVANRNDPISDPKGLAFAISEDGVLVIRRGGRIIWSVNPSGAGSNPVLKLLDTGNLVLVNEETEGSSESYSWQSFNDPMAAHLPGMEMVVHSDPDLQTCLRSWKSWDDPSPGEYVLKIENWGLPELAVYRGEKKMYRSGVWNGVYFSGFGRLANPIFYPELFTPGDRLIYVLRANDSSIFNRGLLDPSGLSHRYIMNAQKDKWNHMYTLPRDQCDEYDTCGPNSVCRIDMLGRCECLKGFAPTYQQDWDLQDWLGGCSRIKPLSCGSGDGLLVVRKVQYPDMLKFWLNSSMSMEECKAECLKNCSCTACANPFVNNGGRGCVLWFGDLIDIRRHFDPDSEQNMYIRVPISELVDSSTIDIQNKKEKWSTRFKILMSVAFGVAVAGLINGGVLMLTRRKRKEKERSNVDLELPLFKFETIAAATNNFSGENMIGEGGFGPVYKGNLSSNEEIAVKRLSRTSGQGLEEFKNEAVLISKLQHTNLVRLLGCCIERDERILIYEYLQNKSLDYFVFDQERRKLLTWPNRFNIVMGIARGLLYLHNDSRLKIIHRDMKTSNILLDGNLNPKISDFGIARSFGEDQPVGKTRRVIGTFGYMAPEYATAGKFSIKSDIFSMGVVLLETVSGKKNRGFKCRGDHCHSLLEHAWLLWKKNKIVELMDECFKDTFVESEVKRFIHVGLLCVQRNPEDRPVMSSVLSMLGSDGANLADPKEPGFYIGTSSAPERGSAEPIPMSERNTITIIDLEAR